MSARRWVVSRGELLDPSEFTLDPESECEVVAAEDYERLERAIVAMDEAIAHGDVSEAKRIARAALPEPIR